MQSKYGHLFKMKRLHVLLLQLNEPNNNRFCDLSNLLRPTFYNQGGANQNSDSTNSALTGHC